jgi:hypothetical protein
MKKKIKKTMKSTQTYMNHIGPLQKQLKALKPNSSESQKQWVRDRARALGVGTDIRRKKLKPKKITADEMAQLGIDEKYIDRSEQKISKNIGTKPSETSQNILSDLNEYDLDKELTRKAARPAGTEESEGVDPVIRPREKYSSSYMASLSDNSPYISDTKH